MNIWLVIEFHSPAVIVGAPPVEADFEINRIRIISTITFRERKGRVMERERRERERQRESERERSEREKCVRERERDR